jgi:RHS repeat-associated protein
VDSSRVIAEVPSGQTTATMCYDADFEPYGGEHAYINTCSQNYKFTGKERDTESDLDDFGARYYASTTGRFMSPDEFWKDSDVGDPQSWNKYAYARNNPLRYTDPTGEEATVTTSCNQGNTTCQVNVTASIAIYAVNGTTADQLKQAQSAITSQIDQAWSGSFTQNGTTYNVTTNVTVQIVGSENAGAQSGAQNVIGIDASGTANNHVDPNNVGRSFDKGIWDFSSVTSGQLAPHEFSHILGLDDNHGDVLSNSFSKASMGAHPHATTQDFKWAFGPELKAGKTRFNVGDYEGKNTLTRVNRGNRHWYDGYLNPQKDNH